MAGIAELKKKVKAIYDELCEIESSNDKVDNNLYFKNIMQDIKVKNNVITNKFLSEAEDFLKDSYLKMLGVIIKQGKSDNINQDITFARIIAGVNVDNSIQDYYRFARKIKCEDIDYFCETFKDNDLKYRFIVDAFIIVGVGEPDDNQISAITDIMEAMVMNKKQAEYLSILSKSIIEQDENIYTYFAKIEGEDINTDLFSDYTDKYIIKDIWENKGDLTIRKNIETKGMSIYDLNGQIVEGYYSDSPSYMVVDSKEFFLDNANITFNDSYGLKFDKNNVVVICNCVFTSKSSGMGSAVFNFVSCKKVILYNCIFQDFSKKIISSSRAEEVKIKNCKFINCKFRYVNNSLHSHKNWENVGGVISAYNSGLHTISNSEFTNCGCYCQDWHYASAAIADCLAEVSNCKFENCWQSYYASGSYREEKAPDNPMRTLFVPGTKGRNNIVKNSAEFS